ncbi:MAG TPA: hypothetical protein VLC92_14400 [Rhodocyclaceae bacterium]|nr:hypothetical protein [Rhodocyclaceae bacterium]
MFDWLAYVKAMADMLPRGLNWWFERRDPVRAQAARVLAAFEAHDIARTQIVRLLPPYLALPMTAFVSAQSLREHLTPAFLDWVADFFMLDRAWLDCMPDTQPHSPYPHCFYKQPRELHQWLSERVGDHSLRFVLYVLKADSGQPGERSEGPFALVFRENVSGLDDEALARYELMSDGARFDHPSCIVDLLAACAVADSLSIALRGLVISRKRMQALEEGTMLIAAAIRRPEDYWRPERLLQPSQDASPWWQSIRKEATAWLEEAGLHHVQATLKPSNQTT